MNTKRFLCAALGAVCCFAFMQAQVRTEQTFEKGWKFTREDNAEFANPGYNDSKWQNVTVPHDWAIYGPFSINNDKQEMAITQDGQTEAMEHAGRTGGLPFVGTGWYRLNFDAPGFEKGKKATLIFDGAMSHARVYVNGQEAGYWPYGYNSFYVDATPYLKPGERNELAVRLENEPESSRWYPGAGLYRNVHLVINEDAHIPTWGTYATTPVVTDKYAKVSLKTSLVSPEGANKDNYRIVTQIKDKNGKVVATGENKLSVFDNALFEQEFAVANPELWSPETPVLYTAESKVYEGNTLKDEYTTRFGIRTLEIIPDKGFFLNGKLTKFKGVCNHHDLGPLGGAVNDAAIRRQIRILKDMGCNAIRTSHNMPAPELVEACDEMGMMVMAESFDEWKSAKMANGYHKVFDEWVDKDLTNLIRHYRNNPSIVMWCTGNEVPDQWSGSNGPKLSRMLQDICHREDPTRPVTQGMDAPDAVVNNNMAAVMDVAGFNYRPQKYPENYKKLPQQIILGSETASTVSSRGVYKFPVVRQAMKKYDDHQSSSYDVESCSWSNLPEDDFIQHEDLPYCIGEFVWTGFDYLGESWGWPGRTNNYGIIDLAGFEKDHYYLYQSLWSDEPMVHVLPHWTHPGKEGVEIPVVVYTNGDAAELFYNGKSLGRKDMHRDSLQIVWNVPYRPGTIKAVAYKDGRVIASCSHKTAGKAYSLKLTADRKTMKSNRKDVVFVTVDVTDKKGNFVPYANVDVDFEVKGDYKLIGVENGDVLDIAPHKVLHRKTFNGKALLILQATDNAGRLRIQAKSPGLKSSSVEINVI